MNESSFLGRPRAAWRVGGFALGRWSADRWGDAIAPHGHARAHFMVILGGSYRTDAKPAAPETQPVIVYNPPGTWHSDRFEGPGVFFSIELDETRARDAAAFGLPDHPIRLEEGRQQAAMRRIMRACARRAPDVSESLCLELLAETGVERPGENLRPRWLDRVIDRLRSMPQEPAPIGVLAREANVHPVHLARAFRRHCGCTPGEFQAALRLASAAEALRGGNRPIVEIALDSGFADQSHLTRRFRALYGVPPAVYRRMFV